MSVKLGIVIVSYGNQEDVLALVKNVKAQLKKDDKLILVDNKKPYELSSYLKGHNVTATVTPHDNGGFAAGCNAGAAIIVDDVDVLLFLNPDTYIVQNDYLDRMRSGYGEFDAWQSLLLLPDGRINNYGNNVHITGLTWSDRFKQITPSHRGHKAIKNLSGACFAIDTRWWKKVGGFTEQYFMYFEDVDLSTKVLLAGGRLGILEDAELHHHYDFEKGTHKWQYIERSRLIFMFVNWPRRLLLLTFIPNLFFNVVIFLQYVSKGRGNLKIRSDISFLQNLPEYWTIRREHRKLRRISSKQYFSSIGYAMDTDLLGKLTNNPIVYGFMKTYYSVVKLFFV